MLTIGNPTVGPTPSITTTTTSTTTTATKRRMDRALSTHRIRKPLAKSEQKPQPKERSRSPSPMGRSAPLLKESGSGSENQSGDEIPGPMPPTLFKKTLQPRNRQSGANELGRQRSELRLPRQLAKTGETPRPLRAELSPQRMVNSAPDAPATGRASCRSARARGVRTHAPPRRRRGARHAERVVTGGGPRAPDRHSHRE